MNTAYAVSPNRDPQMNRHQNSIKCLFLATCHVSSDDLGYVP